MSTYFDFLRLQNKKKLLQGIVVGLTLGLSYEKEIWKRDSSSHWWERIVLETFTEEQWIENFRMKRETFEFVCSKLEPTLSADEKHVRKPLDVKTQVAVALYWLASSAEYRTVGNLFGIGTSTVHECVHDVCNALVECLLDDYVRFPKDDDLKDVVVGYEERWGFPNCGGAIDGTHIPIRAPQNAHGDYVNRKGFYSLIMQAVCDYKYIFRDINIGWPGRVHDARVLANSDIFLKGETGALFPSWCKRLQLPDREVSLPIVLIGDPAYPLRPWLLRPYSNRGQLSVVQQAFNYRLSRARMTIENSFGRLKGRWRCLQYRLDVDTCFACTVIAACVILHNVCEIHNEGYNEDWLNVVEANADMVDREDGRAEAAQDAKRLRDDIASAFANNVI